MTGRPLLVLLLAACQRPAPGPAAAPAPAASQTAPVASEARPLTAIEATEAAIQAAGESMLAENDITREAAEQVRADREAMWTAYHKAMGPEISQSTLLREAGDYKEGYRFVWEPSFHSPIVVRIESDGSNVLLQAVRFSRRKKAPSKGISRVLTGDEWKRLRDRLAIADFWQLQGFRPVDMMGADGADWFIEGYKNKRLHKVMRWSPQEGTYRALGLYFLELAGILEAGERTY